MAILGNTTINGSLNINGVPVVPVTKSPILYVTCPTAAATPTKEVEDASRVPVAGDIVIVTFTNGNSVSNPTLNINSDGAKNIRLGTTNASTTTMTVGAGGVVSLYFDGTYYNMFGSYRTSDSNSYDRMYHSVAKQMGETLYRYKLILEGIDGKYYPIVTTNQTNATVIQKTPTNAILKIGGNILCYNTTATVAVDEVVTNTYSELSMTRLVYSFNQDGGYQLQRPIYLVGIPQANGGYKLDSNYYTQNLPTTEDGKIYIQLGLVYAQNSLRLEIEHPIYEFKDGKVRSYIPEHTHDYIDLLNQPAVITQADINTGTSTASKLVTPKLLVDNFSKTNHTHSGYAPIGGVSSDFEIGGNLIVESNSTFNDDVSFGGLVENAQGLQGIFGTNSYTIQVLTQAQYNAIGTKDSNRIYIIVG